MYHGGLKGKSRLALSEMPLIPGLKMPNTEIQISIPSKTDYKKINLSQRLKSPRDSGSARNVSQYFIMIILMLCEF